MGLKETVVQETQKHQIIWHGHVSRMRKERLPKAAVDWISQKGENGEDRNV
jgi:hypothetical protein